MHLRSTYAKICIYGDICTNMQNKNSLNLFHMPQNMYNLLIQDVLVNREKYANAYKSQPYLYVLGCVDVFCVECCAWWLS
jgi:hypothetical protein